MRGDFHRNYFHKRRPQGGRPPFLLRLVCQFLVLLMFFTPAGLASGLVGIAEAATTITPDGKTNTTVTPSGNTYDVVTSTISGSNAFNTFSAFNVGSGDIANLHLPQNTTNLVNLVQDQVVINGMVNSYLTGGSDNNKIGGNIYFASPNGFLLGSSGVLNVGGLFVSTPTQASMNNFISNAFSGGSANGTFISGYTDSNGNFGFANFALNPGAVIEIDGKVNAVGDVNLLSGGSINVAGQINAGQPGVNGIESAVNVPLSGIATGMYQTDNGEIVLASSDQESADSGQASADAEISVTGSLNAAAITGTSPSDGGNVSLSTTADAASSYGWLDNMAENALNTLISSSVEQGLPSVDAGYVDAEATSKIDVGSAAVINAQNLSLNAQASRTAKADADNVTSAVEATALVGILGGSTSATVDSGATLNLATGGNLSVLAQSTNSLDVKAESVASQQNGYGAAATFGLTYSDVATSAALNTGNTIGSAANQLGSVSVRSISNNSFSTKAESVVDTTDSTASAGLTAAIADDSTSSTATLGASLNLSGELLVNAGNSTSQNVTSATSKAAAGISTVLARIDSGQAFQSWLMSKAGSATSNVSDSIGDSGSSSFNFDLAASLAYADYNQSSDAEISGGESVNAGGNVSVLSRLTDKGIQSTAGSKASANLPDTSGASVAVSAAVAVGTYTHNSKAVIGDNVDINAARIGVGASADVPMQLGFDKWGQFGDVFQHYFGGLVGTSDPSDLTLADLLPGLTTNVSATASSGDGSGLGAAGSVNWYDSQNNVNTWVGSGSTLTATHVASNSADNAWTTNLGTSQNPDNWDWENIADIVSTSDNESLNVDGGLGLTSSGTVAVGGAFNMIKSGANVYAGIGDNATVTAGSLGVRTDSEDESITFSPDGGQGKGVAASGILAYKDVNDVTHSSISNYANIDANSVDVTANQGLSDWTVAGDLSYSNSASVGVGVAINDINTDTEADIDDNRADTPGYDSGNPPARTGSKGTIKTDSLNVQSATEGNTGAFAIAAAVAYNGDPNDKSQSFLGRTVTKVQNAKNNITSKLSGMLSKIPVLSSLAGDLGQQKNTSANSNPDVSISGAGSAGVNLTTLDTKSLIDGVNIENLTAGGAVPVTVLSANNTNVIAGAGSGAIVWAKNPSNNFSAAVAGTVALNDLENDTEANVEDATITNSGDLNVLALSSGLDLAAGIGLALNNSGGSTPSISVAGSVSINWLASTVSAGVDDSTITGGSGSANDLVIAAYDKPLDITGGASVTIMGKGGLGGTVALMHSENDLYAGLTGSDVSGFDTASISALDADIIISGGFAGDFSNMNSWFTFSGNFIFNDLNNTLSATVGEDKSGNGSTLSTTGDVTVQAKDISDDSTLDGYIKSATNPENGEQPGIINSSSSDLSNNGGSGKSFDLDTASANDFILGAAGDVSIGGKVAAGLSYVGNFINNSYSATILGSSVNSTGGDVNVDAENGATLIGVAAGVSITTGDFAAIGSATSNVISSSIYAGVEGDSVTGNRASVDADNLNVTAKYGSTTVAVAGNVDYSGSAALGAAIAFNDTGGFTSGSDIFGSLSTKAEVSDADVTLSGTNNKASVSASDSADIWSFAVAVQLASDLALGGSLSINTIGDSSQALVDSGSMISADTLSVNAGDGGSGASIMSLAGDVGISGTATIGAAVTTNNINSDFEASIADSSLHVSSAVDVDASSSDAIWSIAAAGGFTSGNAAVGGSITGNNIDSTVMAGITGTSSDNYTNDTQISATNGSDIESLAGEVEVGLGGGGVGFAAAVNRIGGTTSAYLSNDSQNPDAVYDALDVIVSSNSGETIQTEAAGVSAGSVAGVAGSVATNVITATTEAYIDGGAQVVANDNVGVLAQNSGLIDVAAGSVGFGGDNLGASGSFAVNIIGSTTSAYISGSGTSVEALAQDSGDTMTVDSGDLNNPPDPTNWTDPSKYNPLGSLSETTDQKTGIAVDAADMEMVGVVGYSVSGTIPDPLAGSVAAAGTGDVNVFGGTTSAYVDGADLNKELSGAASSNSSQNLWLDASSHAYNVDYVLGASLSGDLALSGALDTDVITRTTEAYVTDTDINVYGLDVDSDSSIGASSFAVGVGGAVVGAAGTGAIAVLKGDTEARIDGGSNINADSIAVDANNNNSMSLNGGAIALGGAALGGTFLVGVSESTTKALVDDATQGGTSATQLYAPSGISVSATGNTDFLNNAIAGSGGGGDAIAGSVAVNVAENTTWAGISGADIGSGADKAGALSVNSSDTIGMDSNAGSLALSGGTSVGAGANVIIAKSDTESFLDDSDVYASSVDVEADQTKDIAAYTVAAAAGSTTGIGGGASLILLGSGDTGDSTKELNKNNNGTLSSVDSLTGGNKISLTSDTLTTDEQNQVNTESSFNVEDTLGTGQTEMTSAKIDGGTIDTGDVTVKATDKTKTLNVVGSAAAGAIGVGGSVGYTMNYDNVQALITGATNLTSTGSVDIGASALDDGGDSIDINSVTGEAGLVGLGAAVAVGDEDDTVTAGIGGSVNAAGPITVASNDDTTDETFALGAQAGAAAAGAVVSTAEKTGTVSSVVGKGADITSTGGDITIQSSGSGLVHAKAIAAAGGLLLAGNGTVATAMDTSTIKSYIDSGATVDDSGNTLSITATSTPETHAEAYGADISGGVSIGAAVATAESDSTVDAYIAGGSTVDTGTLDVSANAYSPASTSNGGYAAYSYSMQGTGGYLAGANAVVSDADEDDNIAAYIGGSINASGAINVTSGDNAAIYADGLGATAAGLVAAGAVVSEADKTGTVSSYVGKEADITSTGDVTIQAAGSGLTHAYAIAGAGGVGAAVDGSAATATDSSTIESYIDSDASDATTVSDSGNTLSLMATSTPETDAEAYGVAVAGGVGIGAAVAISDADSAADAYITGNSTVDAGTLDVSAQAETPESGTNGGHTAYSISQVGSGGILAGANASVADADSDVNVNSYVDPGAVLTIGSLADISGANDTDQYAYAEGVSVGGILAAGAAVSEAGSSGQTDVYMNSGFNNQGATLDVTASGNDGNFAKTLSGSGGLIAGDAASSTTNDNSTTEAYIQNQGAASLLPQINAKSIVLTASHTSGFDSSADSFNASVAGASGAFDQNNINPTVDAGTGAYANLLTQDLYFDAENTIDKDNSAYGVDFNAQGGAGGVLVGAAVGSDSEIAQNTDLQVGDGSAIDVDGDFNNPGRFILESHNVISAEDYAKLDTGGAITIPLASSIINVNESNADVTVGDNANLYSVGDITAAGSADINIDTNANSKTYGLASACKGTSESTVNSEQDINVGADSTLYSLGKIDLYAGEGADQSQNVIQTTASTNLWNKTAFPVETKPEANATDNQNANVNIASGADLESVEDTNLIATPGQLGASGTGIGQDLYREVLGDVVNAIGSLLGAGSVSLAITGGSSTENTASNVVVDGNVTAGVQSAQYLTLGYTLTNCSSGSGNCDEPDFTITPTSQSSGVTFTTGYEPIGLDIATQLNNLENLIVSQSADPGEVAIYQGEIQALLAAAQDVGMTVEPVQEGGVTFYSVGTDVELPVIDVNPIRASVANINVTADNLTGSGNLSAFGNAYIDIENNTPYSLVVHNLDIPWTTGGLLNLNSQPVNANSDINKYNLTRTGAGFGSISTSQNTSQTPYITVNNNFDPSSAANPASVQTYCSEYGCPSAIFSEGDISNLGGSANMQDSGGSIVVTGNIDANSIHIGTGKDFIFTNTSGFLNVGGDPATFWNSEETNDINSYLNSGPGYGSDTAEKDGTGNIIAGNDVYITANYLNINGLIQSGIPDWEINTESSVTILPTQLETDLACNDGIGTCSSFLGVHYGGAPPAGGYDLANPIVDAALNAYYGRYYPVQTFTVGGTIKKLYWDTVDERLALDGIDVSGGYMSLTGHIMNTGGGRLNVLSGYGKIDITNNLPYDLVVNGLDAGKGVNGTLKITDLNYEDANGVPLTSTYTYSPTGGVSVAYSGATSLANLPGSAGPGRTATYQPEAGLWYNWVDGDTTSTLTTYYWSTIKASFFGLGDLWSLGSVNWVQQGNPVQTVGTHLLTGSYETVGNADNPNPASTYTFNATKETVSDSVSYKSDSHYTNWWHTKKEYEFWKYETTGTDDFYVNSIKADYPINIDFTGYDQGEINITSKGGRVLLNNQVSNPSGTTTIDSLSLESLSNTGDIDTKDLNLDVTDGIGLTGALPVQVSGTLNAQSTGGAINIDNQTGNLTVGTVSAMNSSTGQRYAVDLASPGGIDAAGSGSLIEGSAITLNAGNGGIGTSAVPVNINTEDDSNGVLTATAKQDINLVEVGGDLWLNNITTSTLADVNVTVDNGSLINANNTQVLDTRSKQYLQGLESSMDLTGTGASAAGQQTVNSYDQSMDRLYFEYWQMINSGKNADGTYKYDPFTLTTGQISAMEAEGMTDTQITAYQDQLTSQYNTAVSKFGGGTYDSSFSYTPTSAEIASLTDGDSWTTQQLENSISASLYTGSGSTPAETPVITGRNITINAANGGIGNTLAQPTVIDATQIAGGGSFTQAQQLALVGAEPSDATFYTQNGTQDGYNNGDQMISINEVHDIPINAAGQVSAAAKTNIYLGGTDSVTINNLTSPVVRVEFGGSILSGNTPGTTGQTNIDALTSSIVHTSGGDIGSSNDPLQVEVGTGGLTARATGSIYLQQNGAPLYVYSMSAGGGMDLNVPDGGVFGVNLYDDSLRNYAVSSGTGGVVAINAKGDIGASINPLSVNLGAGGALALSTSGNLYLQSPDNGFAVGSGSVEGQAINGINIGGTGDIYVGGDLALEKGIDSAGSQTLDVFGAITGTGSDDIVTTGAGSSVSLHAGQGIGTASTPIYISTNTLLPLTARNVSDNGDIYLTLPNTTQLENISAPNGLIDITGSGDMDFTNYQISGENGVTLSAAGSLNGGDVTSGVGDVNLTASNGIAITAATSGGTMGLTATNGSITAGNTHSGSDQTMTAGHDINITTQAYSGGDFTGKAGNDINANDAGVNDIEAVGGISLTAGHDINAANIKSDNSSVTTDSTADANITKLNAGTSSDVTAGGGITVTSLTAGTSSDMNAGGGVTVGSLNAGTSSYMTAGSGITVTSLNAGTASAMNAGGDLMVNTIQTGSDQAYTAGGHMLVAQSTDGGNFTATAGSGEVDSLNAGGQVDMTTNDPSNNGGDLVLGSITSTGGQKYEVIGGLTANALGSTGAGIDVASSVNSNIGSATSGGNMDINASNGIAITAATSGGTMGLIATNGSITAGNTHSGSDQTMTAGHDINITTQAYSGGDFTGKAGNGINANDIEALGNVYLTAGGSIEFGTISSQKDVAMNAADAIDGENLVLPNGTLDMNAADLSIGHLKAMGITLKAANDITLKDLQIANLMDLTAQNINVNATQTAGYPVLSINIQGLGSNLVDGVPVAGNVDLNISAGGLLKFGKLYSADTVLNTSGGNIEIDDGFVPHMLTMNTPDLDLIMNNQDYSLVKTNVQLYQSNYRFWLDDYGKGLMTNTYVLYFDPGYTLSSYSYNNIHSEGMDYQGGSIYKLVNSDPQVIEAIESILQSNPYVPAQFTINNVIFNSGQNGVAVNWQ